MSPDHWSESDYCHQMSSQRLTWSEAVAKLGELCYHIWREVEEPFLLELLVWQLVMSTIAHMNNEIMWIDENTAQSEHLDGVQVHDFVSSFLIVKETSTDQRLLEVYLCNQGPGILYKDQGHPHCKSSSQCPIAYSCSDPNWTSYIYILYTTSFLCYCQSLYTQSSLPFLQISQRRRYRLWIYSKTHSRSLLSRLSSTNSCSTPCSHSIHTICCCYSQ